MNSIRYFKIPMMSSLVLLGLLALGLYGQKLEPCLINGRVLDVSDDGRRVVINKGSSVNVITDSLCRVYPFINEVVELDIIKGMGRIQEVYAESCVIMLSSLIDTIGTGDCCELYALLPEIAYTSDLGMLVKWDIIFLKYTDWAPVLLLQDLVAAPVRSRVDTALAALVREANENTAYGETFTDVIKGNLFDGLTVSEALAKTRKKEVELFIEYYRYFPARYTCYDWTFIVSYVDWLREGAPSAEHERLMAQAWPTADSADQKITQGKYTEAIVFYKKALALVPDFTYAIDNLELANTVLTLSKIVNDDPRDVNARYDLGIAYYDLFEYGKALEQFIEARKLGYDSLVIDGRLARIYVRQGKFGAGKRLFEYLVKALPEDKRLKQWLKYSSAREQQEMRPGETQGFIAAGDLKYEDADFEGAIKDYRAALDMDPESREIASRLAKAAKRKRASLYQQWANDYWDDGYLESAKNYWSSAIDVCEGIGDMPAVKEFLNEMAESMYKMAFYDTAIVYFSRMAEIDSTDYEAYVNVGRCLLEKEEYDKAIGWVSRALRICRDDCWVYNILGSIYRRKKDFTRAIENFDRSTQVDPNYRYPYYNLGLVYIEKKDYTRAREFLMKALEVSYDYTDARDQLIYLEYLQNAESELSQDANNKEARLVKARSLHCLDLYKEAEEEFRKIIAVTPDDPLVLACYGYTLTSAEKFAEGRKFLQRSFDLQDRPNTRAWLLYNTATETLKKNPEDPTALLNLAKSHFYWEHYDDAIYYGTLVLLSGQDSLSAMEVIELATKGKEAGESYEYSADYYTGAEYEKSIEYATAAIEKYDEVGDAMGKMWAIFRIGDCYAALHRHADALKYYENAGMIANELGDEGKRATYFSGLGNYYWNIGDYEKALKLKQDAKDLFRITVDLINESWMVFDIGSLHSVTGEPDKTLDNYKKVLETYQRIGYFWGESSVLKGIGSNYISSGDFSLAVDNYAAAMKIAQKINDRWLQMSVYRGLEQIYMDLGDTANALKYCYYYIDAATAIGSKTDRVIGFLDQGLIYLDLTQEYDKAMECYSETRDLAAAVGYVAGEACAIAGIGIVHTRKGNYSKALPFQEEAMEIARTHNYQYELMQMYNEKGETYFGMKKYEMALECHTEAARLAEFLGENIEQWKYELNAGKASEELGNSEKALVFYKKATQTLLSIKNKIQSEELRKGFSDMQKQTEVYKRLIDLLIRLGKPDEALQYMEESKSKMIKDLFGSIKPKTEDKELGQILETVDRVENKKTSIETELVAEKKKPKDEQDQRKIETLTKTLATTEGEFNQLMLRLKIQNRTMYDAMTINPATLNDIQGEIPVNTVILEYFLSMENLYIFCISKQFFMAKSVDVKEDEINGLVNYFAGLVQHPAASSIEDLDEISLKLYDYLIAPVDADLDKFENIVIVPYGILYYLPFHALKGGTGAGGKYLVERKRVSYITSTTLHDLLKGEKRQMDKMIALGNPDGSLPAAATEVKVLKEQVFKNSAVIWTLNEATKKRFLDNAKEYNIVHLATHGYLESNPLNTYLLFAGDSDQDKKLTLEEIAGYVALRERTDLIFLSACQTAMEKGASTGSELVSLAEAFAMAGPPTLIATLWQVNDVSTCDLVVEFYKQLKVQKGDKLGALRTAQLSLLGSGKFSHPFYWAPFILIGDWR